MPSQMPGQTPGESTGEGKSEEEFQSYGQNAVYAEEHGMRPDAQNANVNSSVVLDDELTRLQEMTAVSKTYEEQPTSSLHLTDPAGNGTVNEYSEESMMGDSTGNQDEEEELVRRSVYVGNVDYGTTPQELQEHFNKCGKVVRVTIMVDKFSGHPKGFAYIEFGDQAAANNALMLANSTLRGRQIKVSPKRKNIAGLSRGRGRGRGGRGGPGAAAFFGANIYAMNPFNAPMRGFGRGSGAPYAPRLRGRGATAAAMAGPY